MDVATKMRMVVGWYHGTSMLNTGPVTIHTSEIAVNSKRHLILYAIQTSVHKQYIMQ